MANWQILKAAIADVIKTNGNQEITGQVLQNVLKNIVTSIGANATFAGIAGTNTNPGTPDGPVFYLAGEGTYTNFNNLVIETGQLGVLIWNGSWIKQVLEIGAGGGNMILDWNTDIATTRKQVLLKQRKAGLIIAYDDPNNGWVNEQYIGSNSNLYDILWTLDSNWQKIPNGPKTDAKFSDYLSRIYGIYWKDNTGLLSNGYENANNYYESTDYIPVYPGLTLNVSITNSFSSYHNCLYDKNKKFLQTIDTIGDIIIPDNAYYIRICNNKSNKKRSIILDNYNYSDKGELEIEKDTIKECSLIANETLNNALAFSSFNNKILNYLDGTTRNYAMCVTSDFIDVSEYTLVKITNLACATNSETALACFYDSSKSFLSSIRYEERNTIINKNIVIPSEAKFMRISCNTYNISEYSGSPIIYIPIDLATVQKLSENAINNSLQELDIYQNNILENTIGGTAAHNSALNSDGSVSSYGNCITFGMYDVSNINYVLLKNCVCASNKKVMLACFYDEGKIHIDGENIIYDSINTVYDKLIKIPENAKFAKFGINKNNVESYKDNFGVYTVITLEDIKEIANENKPYYGQRILSLGDSYTYLNYYGPYLAKTTGCTQRGRGQNGNLLRSFANDSYSTSNGAVEEPFNETLLADYDIVTIMGGTNDYGHGGTTLGSFETMEEDAALGNEAKTIYGSVYYLISKILTLKPSVKIFFCTQPFRLPYELNATGPGGYEENTQGLTMEKIAEAIKDVCGHFGIPVFDFYHCSGWNPWTIKFTNPESPSSGNVVENRYTYDGLHPKNGDGNGADLLGTAFGNFINSH